MWVVVPIKTLTRAKQRLASVLTPRQRAQLMECMIEDVLDAVRATPDLAGAAVVTADARVRRIAARFNARCLPEAKDAGLCGALHETAATLRREGVASMLIMPADVPLLTSSAVARVCRMHSQMAEVGAAAVTLVAATADGGTNALALSPPDLIAPAFGYNSFQRHCASARAQGLYPLVLRIRELALDIDGPDNLVELLRQPSRTRTQRYLQDTGLAESLLAHTELPLQGDQAG